MNKQDILKQVEQLYHMHQLGLLGGEVMPEDENPQLDFNSSENYLYFTLPMALNYQRSSYTLWKSAKETYLDQETTFVFDPFIVIHKTFEEVQVALMKYKLVLQKQKQTEIWIKLCHSLVTHCEGDIRNLLMSCDYQIDHIKSYIQKEHKKDFPYLSGIKICNYWLYVLHQYTDVQFRDLENLTVAPDTHVVQSSYRLGIITEEEMHQSNVQYIVIERWEELLRGTHFYPIDLHTPMWLWSRHGFMKLEEKSQK